VTLTGRMLFYVDNPDLRVGEVFVAEVSTLGWGIALPVDELEIVGHVDEKLQRAGFAFYPEDMYLFQPAIDEAMSRGIPLDLEPEWYS
jgi:hypothetical protein